ncbi:MAG: S8 family serine peptidase, partial [Planctomycetota bacterium]|nr:S8 family serine peptidase [Planctomycetota bacterium]
GSNQPIYRAVDPHWSDDGAFFPFTNASSPLINLDDFRADPRFAGIDGSGYSVVVMDTGIDLDHPFFGPDANANGIADRIVFQYDFANGDNNATDYNGHGSNVTSIVGSSDATYTGMAPGANLIHLKVFSDAGAGNFGWLESALQWVVANAATYNIVSVNMSLGDSANYNNNRTLYGVSDELAALAAMNIIPVAANGNDFYGFGSALGVAYPAADPNTIAVGAVYDSSSFSGTYGSGAQAYSSGPDRITPFSQRHPTLTDIFAPGAPITGASHNGGLVTQHGTSQAAPHIAGIAALAQQYAMQRLGRLLTLAEFRTLIDESGVDIVDGDDESDNVTNSGLTFRRIDVFALGEAISDLAPGPEIAVEHGGVSFVSGSTLAHYGPVFTGATLSKTFTVRNTGDMDLELTGSISVPTGFTVSSSFGSTTIAAGASTTFVISVDTSSPGDFSGVVSFATNDDNEDPFTFNVAAFVGDALIIDNSIGVAAFYGQNFSASTGTVSSAGGYDDNYVYAAAASGTATRYAWWVFPNLDPGTYRVSATWVQHANRATNSPFSIYDDSDFLDTVRVNQEAAPSGVSDGGVDWTELGLFTITGDTLVVTLGTNANQFVIADAIRIESFNQSAAFVTSDDETLASGATLAYGSFFEGATATRTFTVANSGTQNLTLSNLSAPTGFSIAAGFASATVAPGASTTFQISFDPPMNGDYSGALTFNTNDPDNATYAITLTASSSASVILDNGASSFGYTNNVGNGAVTGDGYENDYRWFAPRGSGPLAYVWWLFGGISEGRYRVSVTWVEHSNRATNAPFSVYDNQTLLETIAVNQEAAPSDRTTDGADWDDLGLFDIESGTLTVVLTNQANEYVIADAVRIERIGDISSA